MEPIHFSRFVLLVLGFVGTTLVVFGVILYLEDPNFRKGVKGFFRPKGLPKGLTFNGRFKL